MNDKGNINNDNNNSYNKMKACMLSTKLVQ